MYNKLLLNEFMNECVKVIDTPAAGNELEVAKEICKSVIQGNLHHVEIPNSSSNERKRLVAIAYQLVKDKPLWCRVFGTHDGKNCCDCNHVCSYNRILIRRFTEEMFPGRGA